MVVKMFLVITMTTLNLSAMPRCVWPNSLVLDAKAIASQIQRMCAFCIPVIGIAKLQ